MPADAVIFNVFGHGNKGDAMLLEALLDQIFAQAPDARVEGVAFNVESERRWFPGIVWHERIGNRSDGGGRFARVIQVARLAVLGAIAGSRAFLGLRRLLPPSQRAAIEALNGAELAISCPGGYLEDSNHAYILNIIQMLLAARLAKKVVLAPQSIGPARSPFGRKLLAYALRRVDAIYVREEESRAFVEGLPGKAVAPMHSSGDMAFWFDRPVPGDLTAEWSRIGVDPLRPVYGLTVVGWPFPQSSDPAAERAKYLSALSALIDRICEDPAAQVVAFNQVSADLATVDELAAMNPRLIVDREERDCALLAAMIASCNVLVGSRFHSCIFGLIGGVPTIAIAYLPKTSGIMEVLGLADLTLPIDDLQTSELLALYDRVAGTRMEVARRVRDAVTDYRASKDSFILDLGGLLAVQGTGGVATKA